MFTRAPPYAMIAMTTLALLSLLPSISLAATYQVPWGYATIGEAIANASAGDTITVDSGTYHENIVIGKALTLIGRDTGLGLPTIDADQGMGIEVFADDVIVQRFRVVNGGTGIKIHDCGGSRIADSIVVGNVNGILLSGAHGITIMNNTVTGNNDQGIYLADTIGSAIYLNKVTNNQYGIVLAGISSTNTVYMNALKDNSGANGLANGKWNNWNSSIPFTYGYNGRQFSNYLGNYWGNLKGSDDDSDGILDADVMLADNNGDYDPLVEIPLDRPAANFTSDSTAGTAPLRVQFTDASKGYPVSWHWDFGDGSASDAQGPAHTYGSPGAYTVSLTVQNAHGEDRIIRSNYVVVSPAAVGPTATPSPALSVTPGPWPTATPAPAGSTPTPTPKPTPGIGWAITLAGAGAACALAGRKQ